MVRGQPRVPARAHAVHVPLPHPALPRRHVELLQRRCLLQRRRAGAEPASVAPAAPGPMLAGLSVMCQLFLEPRLWSQLADFCQGGLRLQQAKGYTEWYRWRRTSEASLPAEKRSTSDAPSSADPQKSPLPLFAGSAPPLSLGKGS